MRWFAALLLLFVALPAQAQIPPEWDAAAKVVIGALEKDTPNADKPWKNEVRSGWGLARGWRQNNHGNIEIILAEYLTFTMLCREDGCPNSTVAGKPYREMAAEMKALRMQQGDSYALARNVHDWLAGLADPTGAAQKNVAMWSKDPDASAADAEVSDLYALYWILAKAKPTSAEQAATFARYALFVHGKGWIGARCLDIAKVATVLDAPPMVESCQ